MTAPIISARLAGHEARIKPKSFLGGDSFESFKKAIEGAKYQHEFKANFAPLDLAGKLLARLQDAGFAIEIDPKLASAIQQADAVKKKNGISAIRRVNGIEAELLAQGKSLYPFQKEGVRWLAPRERALLADDPGLGKTVQSLLSLPDFVPVIVVCPAVAKGVWETETKRWRPGYRTAILSGKESFRYPVPGEIVILNYDILPSEPAAAPAGLYLVGDEIQAVKNAKSQRTTRFRALSQAAQEAGGCTWGLSGTPIEGKALELWAVLTALNLAQEAFGNFKTFAAHMGGTLETIYVRARTDETPPPSPESKAPPIQLVTDPPGFVEDTIPPKAVPKEVWVWGEIPAPRAVGERLASVMLRRRRTEVLPQLPVKRYRAIDCGPLSSKRAIKLCDEAAKLLPPEDELPPFEQIAEARAALAKAKMPMLRALLDESDEQGDCVLVFSCHRAPIDDLQGRPGWAVITGDTPPTQRAALEAMFQEGQLRGLGLTIQAGGVALTLIRAAHAIFVDRHWTPTMNVQAEDRICRIGQNRGCLITDLVTDHALDRRVREVILKKQKLIDESVEQAVLFLDFAQ
jgi:SNF2 family DNA or RNA helicase